ncbi:MAG: hypothetical protein QXU32_08670 [Nitrososphaerales archaeon]
MPRSSSKIDTSYNDSKRQGMRISHGGTVSIMLESSTHEDEV